MKLITLLELFFLIIYVGTMSALISDLASYWVARDARAALGPHTPVLWSSGPHTRTTRWGATYRDLMRQPQECLSWVMMNMPCWTNIQKDNFLPYKFVFLLTYLVKDDWIDDCWLRNSLIHVPCLSHLWKS